MTTNITFDGEDVPKESLPIPVGWRVLLAPIHIDERTSGGIILHKADIEGTKHVRFVGKVMAIGPLAFTGDKFKAHPNAPAKPWYQVGDIISTSQYAGSTLPCKYNGESFYFRTINDEEAVTLVPDLSLLDV